MACPGRPCASRCDPGPRSRSRPSGCSTARSCSSSSFVHAAESSPPIPALLTRQQQRPQRVLAAGHVAVVPVEADAVVAAVDVFRRRRERVLRPDVVDDGGAGVELLHHPGGLTLADPVVDAEIVGHVVLAPAGRALLVAVEYLVGQDRGRALGVDAGPLLLPHRDVAAVGVVAPAAECPLVDLDRRVEVVRLRVRLRHVLGDVDDERADGRAAEVRGLRGVGLLREPQVVDRRRVRMSQPGARREEGCGWVRDRARRMGRSALQRACRREHLCRRVLLGHGEMAPLRVEIRDGVGPVEADVVGLDPGDRDARQRSDVEREQRGGPLGREALGPDRRTKVGLSCGRARRRSPAGRWSVSEFRHASTPSRRP